MAKINFTKEHFDKTESDWVLVQIIEDENYPDLVGQFKAMKLPKAIMNRLQAKMKPTDPTKPKQPLMDYLFGPVLELDVVPGPDDPTNPGRRSREVNYDLCDFATDPTPIINVDGTPFFSDEEIELIEEPVEEKLYTREEVDAEIAEVKAHMIEEIKKFLKNLK